LIMLLHLRERRDIVQNVRFLISKVPS